MVVPACQYCPMKPSALTDSSCWVRCACDIVRWNSPDATPFPPAFTETANVRGALPQE